MNKEPLLKVDNLKTHFNTATGIVKAVDGVTFSLDSGQTLGIVGESGCGKSVTSSSIMRLLPKNGHIVEGSILFEGKDIVKLSQKEMLQIRGNDISMIFQDPMTALDPVYTIGSQIMEVINAHQKMSKAEAKECLMTGKVDNIKYRIAEDKKIAKTFDFTELQADAILDMRLSRLIGLELEALKKENEKTKQNIEKYIKILSDKKNI